MTAPARKQMTAKMLLLTVFCCVSGGPFGLEGVIMESGQGVGLLLVLLIPLLWAVPDAFVTAELSSALPLEGGYYQWVKRALGPFAAFLDGWWTWLYGMIDASLYPIYFAQTVGTMIAAASGSSLLEAQPFLQWMVGFTVILCFTWINVRGTRLVGQTSSILAGIIIVPFLILGIIAAFRWGSNPQPLVTSFLPEEKSMTAALSGGLGIAMWNYLGWDSLSTIAEEVEEPQKAFPTAFLLGVPIVTGVYLISVLAGLAIIPDASKWTEGVWVLIAQKAGGPWLMWIVFAAAAASSMALFTATFLGASRLPFVMARDGFLPNWLIKEHPKYGTPWVSILLCGTVYAILSAVFTWRELIAVNVVLYATALVMESITLVVLRIKEPDLPRPFKLPGGLPVAVLFGVVPFLMICLLIGLTIIEEGWQATVPTMICLLSGVIAWPFAKAASLKSGRFPGRTTH
jgi:amino acid transporter